MAIRIDDYRADWPDAYRRLAESLRRELGEGAMLHHIGSTAVPGLAAKDVIDLQLTVAALDAVDDGRMTAAGFERVPHIAGDHRPAGLAVPADDLAKRFYKAVERSANLHVRVEGRFNQRYPLLCRDYLRAHADVAASYALVKRRLAARLADDAAAYSDIKDPVFDLIMAGAGAWAAATRWRLPPAD